MRQLSWGCRPPKLFDGHTSVKYLGGLHPLNIRRTYIRGIFGGVYTPEIFDGHTCVKYLGGLHPQNI